MYCKYCGTDVEENGKFCQNCGAEVEATPVDAAEPVVNNEFEELKKTLGGSVFTLGLLGLIFCASGWLAIAGLIMSAVAKKKAALYQAYAGELDGRAKAGSILAKIGLAVGIVSLVILAFSFIIGVVAGLMEAL